VNHMERLWSSEVWQVLESLEKLPQVRYAFVPGYDGNPEGNSIPGSRLTRENGEFVLRPGAGTSSKLRDLFAGYSVSLVADMLNYKCVRGVNKWGHVRELAPCIPAYYGGNAEAEAIVRAELMWQEPGIPGEITRGFFGDPVRAGPVPKSD